MLVNKFDLAMLIYFSYQFGSVIPEKIPTFELLEDGYLKDNLRPWEESLTIPDGWNRFQMSACFWIHPFRHLQTNSILSATYSSISSPSVSIMLIEGSLVVKITKCVFAFVFKPPIREWSHICVTAASDDTQLYINGTSFATKTCKLNNIFDSDVNEILLKIGLEREVDIPLSGKLADVRIYWRSLSFQEVMNVSKTDIIPSDYQIIPRNITFQHKDVSQLVRISSVAKEVLLRPYMPYVLLYFSDRLKQRTANDVCTKYKSSLPSLENHGKEILTELIYQYTFGSGNSINSFWMSKANEESNRCPIGNYLTRPIRIEVIDNLCNISTMSFFCVLEKGVSFSLIGFSEENIRFYPVPYEIGVFETPQTLQLALKTGHFFITDVSFKHPFYYALIPTASKLVGRHKWYNAQDNLFAKEITFSGCEKNQFSCSDGSCIDILGACNLVGNCNDKSDEAFCEVGMKPTHYYDNRLVPSSYSDSLTKLELNLTVQRIPNVKFEENTIDFSLFVKIGWIDERLEFKFLRQNQSMIVSDKLANTYWQPDIFVKEAISSHTKQLSFKYFPGTMSATSYQSGSYQWIDSYEAIVYSGESVQLENEKTEEITLMCNMDLFYFPFDNQQCSIDLRLVNLYTSNFAWDYEKVSAALNPAISLQLYKILDFSYEIKDPKEIIMQIRISRKYGAYIFNTFLPSTILELIGLMTHMLPLEDFNDRIAVTLSCLIVMAAFFTQISGSLPPSAEPKMIDIWMFMHVLLLFIVFMVQVAVISLFEAQRDYKESQRQEFNYKQLGLRKEPAQSDDIKIMTETCTKEAWKKDSVGRLLFLKPCTANKIGFIACSTLYGLFLTLFFITACKMFEPDNGTF